MNRRQRSAAERTSNPRKRWVQKTPKTWFPRMAEMFVEVRAEDDDVIAVAVVPPDTSLGTRYQDMTMVLAREVNADVPSVYEVRDGKRCLLLPITWPILKNLTDPARDDATPPPEGHSYAVVMGEGVSAMTVPLPPVAKVVASTPRLARSPFPKHRRRQQVVG